MQGQRSAALRLWTNLCGVERLEKKDLADDGICGEVVHLRNRHDVSERPAEVPEVLQTGWSSVPAGERFRQPAYLATEEDDALLLEETEGITLHILCPVEGTMPT